MTGISTTEATESHDAIRAAAAELFGRLVDQARVEKAEATPDRFDRELWSAIAEAGLIGVAVREDHGGLGLGAVETALVLEQLGRVVAPVPLADAVVAAWFLDAHGSSPEHHRFVDALLTGSAVAAVAVPSSTTGLRLRDGLLDGTVVGVPWAHVADMVLLPVDGAVVAASPNGAGVTGVREETTSRQFGLTMTFTDTPAALVGGADAASVLTAHMRVALGAVQAGVTDAAVHMTASYTTNREQFGKPLSTFQAVALKAADAYLDATAIRATVLQAAAALDGDADATLDVLTAAWWAAEAGQHCVHLTQHLHGGMGADVTYPVHRYFLWAKQIELMLGGASALLAELGIALDGRPDAGHAIVL